MKKVLSLILALATLFAFTACGDKQNGGNKKADGEKAE